MMAKRTTTRSRSSTTLAGSTPAGGQSLKVSHFVGVFEAASPVGNRGAGDYLQERLIAASPNSAGTIEVKTFRLRLRAAAGWPLLAMALASIGMGWSDSPAGTLVAYSIDFHSIVPGGGTLRNSCFVLSGTVGQAAPGYSSTTSGAPAYAAYAGFWAAAPAAGADEIFFTGFEVC